MNEINFYIKTLIFAEEKLMNKLNKLHPIPGYLNITIVLVLRLKWLRFLLFAKIHDAASLCSALNKKENNGVFGFFYERVSIVPMLRAR